VTHQGPLFDLSNYTVLNNSGLPEGAYTFYFSVDIGQSYSDSVDVNIFEGIYENTAPVAVDDTFTTDQDTAIFIDVLANDTDADSDHLAIVAVQFDAAFGTAITDGAQIQFTPTAGYTGDVTFTYQISDGIDTDTAVVTGIVEGEH